MGKILFVCGTTHTAFRDYVMPIMQAVHENGEDVYCLWNRSNGYHGNNNGEEIHIGGVKLFYYISPSSKLLSLMHKIFPVSLLVQIQKLRQTYSIDTVWFPTIDLHFAFILPFLLRCKILYTVHDAIPHERGMMNLRFYLTAKFAAYRKSVLINGAGILVSNSKDQVRFLQKRYPSKRVAYHLFPSLANDTLKTGRQCPELEGVNDYILFFGRIEKYKGVDLLYRCFLQHPDLQNKRLVIAGGGSIYFERDVAKEQMVVFVNRRIEDSELYELFHHSAFVVYPYISATQSGIISYPYRWGKLVILSDIPYFREVAIDGETALFFRNNNIESLYRVLLRAETADFSSIVLQAKKYYKEIFSFETLKKQLSLILYR